MKRLLILIVVLGILATSPAFSQWRLDLGLDIAFAGGAFAGGESEVGDFDGRVLPLPVATGAYQFDAGPVGVGVGLRAVPLIVIFPFWPNAFAEVDLGRATIEAHIGGLLFGYIGLASGIEAGKVFIPEVSGWFKLSERFRLGGGAIGVWVPDADIGDDEEGVSAWLFFAGVKWVITN